MNLKEILDRTTAFFKEKKLDSPRLDAEILLSYGLGMSRIDLYLKHDQPIKESELEKLREIVRRRSQGEPVAYILGEKGFFGETFFVGPEVLIPRPETELLVEAVLSWQKKSEISNPTILDLGCGSGCIGLSLLKQIPQAKMLAVDISAPAIRTAQKNAENLGVHERSFWFQQDAFNCENTMAEFKKNLADRIDILVANPPYIDPNDVEIDSHVKKFEPSTALFSDENGLKHLKNWSALYSNYLSNKSIVMMEIGYNQGNEIKNHFEKIKNFDVISVDKDLSGKDRFIRAEIRGNDHG